MGVPVLCVDASRYEKHSAVGISDCKKGGGADQNFTLTWHKDVRPKGRTVCWDVSNPQDKAEIILYGCHGMGGNQYWKYDVVISYNFLKCY